MDLSMLPLEQLEYCSVSLEEWSRCDFSSCFKDVRHGVEHSKIVDVSKSSDLGVKGGGRCSEQTDMIGKFSQDLPQIHPTCVTPP